MVGRRRGKSLLGMLMAGCLEYLGCGQPHQHVRLSPACNQGRAPPGAAAQPRQRQQQRQRTAQQGGTLGSLPRGSPSSRLPRPLEQPSTARERPQRRSLARPQLAGLCRPPAAMTGPAKYAAHAITREPAMQTITRALKDMVRLQTPPARPRPAGGAPGRSGIGCGELSSPGRARAPPGALLRRRRRRRRCCRCSTCAGLAAACPTVALCRRLWRQWLHLCQRGTQRDGCVRRVQGANAVAAQRLLLTAASRSMRCPWAGCTRRARMPIPPPVHPCHSNATQTRT